MSPERIKTLNELHRQHIEIEEAIKSVIEGELIDTLPERQEKAERWYREQYELNMGDFLRRHGMA